jgi:hypothetical protein
MTALRYTAAIAQGLATVAIALMISPIAGAQPSFLIQGFDDCYESGGDLICGRGSRPSEAFATRSGCASMPTPPAWSDGWEDPANTANCNIVVDGVTFHSGGDASLLTNHTAAGKINPDFQNNAAFASPACVAGNALWVNNNVNTAPAGSDLSNPGMFNHLKNWYIKNSVHEGTTHITDGHEDLIQIQETIGGGGWFVVQDSLFRNADENMFMQVGSGANGFGNGPGSDPACYYPEGQRHTGGVSFQGVDFGPNVGTDLDGQAYSGSAQINIGGTHSDEALGEVWLIDVILDSSYQGIGIWDKTKKVVVVGGTGGTRGWPGPLKVRYGTNALTESNCPSAWSGTTCLHNGLLNGADGSTPNQGIPYSWDGSKGDNPADGVIPVYYYDNIEAAIKDGHAAPRFARRSCSGWANPPIGCDSTGYVAP